MSWKWEMNDHDNWITNGVRFATKAEAEGFGFDLACRWLGMPQPSRAAVSFDSVNYRWDGKLVAVEADGIGGAP